MNQENVGHFIAELRKEKNMTQQELADKLCVTDRAVSNWENGIRMPDYSLLSDLCSHLDLDINEILSVTSNKNEGIGGIDTKGVARKIY